MVITSEVQFGRLMLETKACNMTKTVNENDITEMKSFRQA